MKINLAIISILLFGLFACKKINEDKRSEFIGHWHAIISDYYCATIHINESGNSYYSIIWQGDETSYGGKARANDKHLYIGSSKSFDIIEYPHTIDTSIEHEYVYYHDGPPKIANWKMVLYGLKPSWLHVCGKWTYYKADY